MAPPTRLLADRLGDLFQDQDVIATRSYAATWLVLPSRNLLPQKTRAAVVLLCLMPDAGHSNPVLLPETS